MGYREIPVEELRALIYYDEHSGLFYRLDGSPAGSTNKIGYVVVSIKNRKYLAHRLAWIYKYGEPALGELDHVNRIRSDNRICNLRIVNRSENMQNMILDNPKAASGLVGAFIDKRRFKNRFYSKIKVDGRAINLGVFDTAEAASLAYLNAKEKLHIK
jgi:hypothetical protein